MLLQLVICHSRDQHISLHTRHTQLQETQPVSLKPFTFCQHSTAQHSSCACTARSPNCNFQGMQATHSLVPADLITCGQTQHQPLTSAKGHGSQIEAYTSMSMSQNVCKGSAGQHTHASSGLTPARASSQTTTMAGPGPARRHAGHRPLSLLESRRGLSALPGRLPPAQRCVRCACIPREKRYQHHDRTFRMGLLVT